MTLEEELLISPSLNWETESLKYFLLTEIPIWVVTILTK